MAWGPWGLRGFSLTARTKEERKLMIWRCYLAAIKFVSKGGYSYSTPPCEMSHAPSPEYADASTWNEYNGLYLVRDLVVRGGMQQQGGDTQASKAP